MGNKFWSLKIQFEYVFLSILLVANTCTCLVAGNITTVACSEQERLALLKFKHSILNDNVLLSSWVGNDCCRWERVICDRITGYVVGLHLRGGTEDNIYGDDLLVGEEVSPSLGELRHLKYLDLSGNYFQGSRIPKFIGSLKQLSYLNLSDAGLYGVIPQFIGNLSNLKVLDLSDAGLYGLIPHVIGNLSNLKVLDLGLNYNNDYQKGLSADDLAWISGLSSLEYLDLSYSDLSGANNRDMVFYMISSLIELSLSGCRLSNADLDPLLNSSTSLSNIKHLDLSYNSFYGQVPHIFQDMTSLQFLDLSGFNLSLALNSTKLLSMIPSLLELHLSKCGLQEKHLNFSTLSNIQHLDLSDNLFQGRFPSVLTNMTSLRVLDLLFCSLNSSIPVIPNLLELHLSYNNFKQLEDIEIWRLASLRSLYVRSSGLTGRIPECFGRLKLLEILDISGNHLTGRILTTFHGKLTRLDLSDNHLSGSIPESMGRLESLTELYLDSNQLTGPILTFHSKLTRLNLSYNYLNGSIPESMGSLASLTELNLESNRLTGSIPSSLGKLVSLHAFFVSSNALNGTIPVSVGQLTKLQYLDISDNSLEGGVFETHFVNLSLLKDLNLSSNPKLSLNFSRKWKPPFQLRSVDLSSCKIADGFPEWVQGQKELGTLALSNVSISGFLPTWLRKLSISDLDLSHNHLSGPLTNLPNNMGALLLQHNLFNGSIPRSICTRTNLYVLNLSRNRFTGKIPNCLGDLQNLQYMMLSSNGLYGVIPTSLGHCSQLEWLTLYNNSFIGELPEELGNIESLKVLDLGNNEFSGNIPERIGEKLANLLVFRIHKNNFTGRIPPSLCKISSMHVLDVAHNKLTGSIPHCLGELFNMVFKKNMYPNIDDVNPLYDENVIQVIKGVALEYTKTLRFLINMDLSSNKLIGEIPVELTALSGLLGLNLSNNHLTGRIPENIGNMKSLISLDFSGNELNGMIPISIADLTFLSHLNLSHNNLSGQIPTGSQLQTLNDPSIYVGNNGLCGYPSPKNCSPREDPTTIRRTADGSKRAWLYGLDITCGFATGFCGVVGVLMLKKQWRDKFFMFAEATMGTVAVMVRLSKMKKRT